MGTMDGIAGREFEAMDHHDDRAAAIRLRGEGRAGVAAALVQFQAVFAKIDP